MTLRTATIRPGFLVALATTVKGGVSYARVDLEPDHTTEEGARRARWETKREIPDPAEFEAATVARGKARSLVTAVCCRSSFGLLCPATREADLQDAIEEARKVADAHNAGAAHTRVEVFVLAGRIASDDAEAARAIASEVRTLMEDMQAGIRAAAPEAIREAANKARSIAGMLSPEISGKVSAAIGEARAVARELVRRIKKSGERAADAVAQLSVAKIEAARFAVLDLDEGETQESAGPAAPALDMEPGETTAAPMMGAPLALEF